MAEGQAVAYDVVLRNEPGGPCTGGLGGPTLSGSIALATSRPAGDTISQIAIWLEAPDPAGPRVLPVAGALSTDGGPVAPSGCAGRTAAGCTPSIQATVGNVAYPDGPTATVPAGTTVTLPFRYFPILAAEDLDRVAAGPVTLAVAVTSQDGVRIARRTVTFVAAAALGDVQAVAPFPGGSSATAPVNADIAPGDQVDLPGAFAYTTGPADPDTISTRIDATAARPGPVTATPVSITTLVTTDGSQRPGLSPVAWPDAVTAGAASTVTLTVAPTGSVSGPVTVTGGGVTRALVDDGSGADLVGADSVFSGRIDLTAPGPDPVVLTVAADLDGTATTGTVEIEVLPAGAPTGPAPHGRSPRSPTTTASWSTTASSCTPPRTPPSRRWPTPRPPSPARWSAAWTRPSGRSGSWQSRTRSSSTPCWQRSPGRPV